MFKDQQGAVFDVAEENITRFEDIFNHLKDQRRINFEIARARQLPELREDDSFNRGASFGTNSGGQQLNGSGYNGGYQRGAFGGGNYGGASYGGTSRGGNSYQGG